MAFYDNRTDWEGTTKKLGEEIDYVFLKKPMPVSESPATGLGTAHHVGCASEVLTALRSDLSGPSPKMRERQEEETHEILVHRISSLSTKSHASHRDSRE